MPNYGFTYNGTHSDTYNVTAQNTVTGAMPPANGVTQDVPLRPGTVYNRTDVGTRWIRVEVAITQTSNTALRTQIRQIGQWLSPANGPQALVFDNDPDITYYGVVDEGGGGGSGSQSTDIEQMVTLGQGTLMFMCPDPFGYEAQASVSFAGGAAAPNVGGSYKTDPVFNVTFTQATNNLTIQDTTTGKSLIIDHAFASGDTLMIDCSKRQVQINGVNTMTALDLSSDWIQLQPGTNNLTISDATANATVDFSPRWL